MGWKLTWALAPMLSLAVTTSAVEVSAQPPHPVTTVPGTVTVPCCRCIGGESQRVSINTGTTAWRVSGPGVGGFLAWVITNNIPSLWTASLPPAHWIHPNNNNGSATEPGGVYRYEITIVVPHCVIPMRVTLQGRAAADDQLVGFLDGSQIAVTPTNAIASPPPVPLSAPGWGFRAERVVSFTVPVAPGAHVLRFEVRNGSPGPTGLLVNAALTTLCSTALQHD